MPMWTSSTVAVPRSGSRDCSHHHLVEAVDASRPVYGIEQLLLLEQESMMASEHPQTQHTDVDLHYSTELSDSDDEHRPATRRRLSPRTCGRPTDLEEDTDGDALNVWMAANDRAELSQLSRCIRVGRKPRVRKYITRAFKQRTKYEAMNGAQGDENGDADSFYLQEFIVPLRD